MAVAGSFQLPATRATYTTFRQEQYVTGRLPVRVPGWSFLMAVTVRRFNRQERFTTISNEFLRADIPLSAFRVACYLMTHTEAWQMTHKSIGAAIGLNSNTVGLALGELDRLGYLVRNEIRNERGHRVGTELLISDVPFSDIEREALTRKIRVGMDGQEIQVPEPVVTGSLVTDSGTHKKTKPPKGTITDEKTRDQKLLPDEWGDVLPLDLDLEEQRQDSHQGHEQAMAAEFEEWYALYPRKVGKQQALRAYRSARKKASAAVLLAGLQRYALQRQGEDPTYTKHPSTWLNGGCWEDIDQPRRGGPESPFHRVTAADNDGWDAYEPAQEIDRTERIF